MEAELTIIVPVFNEEKNIERLTDSLSKYINRARKTIKVLFINDGSSDGSLQLLKAVCSSNAHFEYIDFKQNAGLSAAIKAGFDHSNTPLTGYIDADLQTDPRDFDLLLEHIGEYDLVTGVRADRKDSFLKNTSSKIANAIRNAFTHDGMDDTGCPLKIIKTSYAKKIPLFDGLHRFLPAMVLLQKGRIKQVPVRHYERIAGKSNFGLSNRLISPLIDCFAYLWMKSRYINYEIKHHDTN